MNNNYLPASLTLTSSSSESKYTLNSENATKIGRSPECQIVLNPEEFVTVSRLHAVIELVEKDQQISWQITNNSATNGTLVNGEKITDAYILTSGDRIMLGLKGPEFLFEMETLNPTVLVEIEEKEDKVEHKQATPVNDDEEKSVKVEPKTEEKEATKTKTKSRLKDKKEKEETTTKTEEKTEEESTTKTKTTSRLKDKKEEAEKATESKEKEVTKTRAKSRLKDKKEEAETTAKTEEKTEEESTTKTKTTSRLKDKKGEAEESPKVTKVTTKTELKSTAKTETKLTDNQGKNIWNLVNYQIKQNIEIETKNIQCLAFSPDGTKLAFAGKDKQIKLWNLVENKEIATIDKAHKMSINTLVFSPDGEKLASGGSDKTIKIWNLANQEEIATLTENKQAINSLIFSNDGQQIITATNDKIITIFNLEDQTSIASFSGHKLTINSLTLNADGTKLISSGADKLIKIWDLTTNQEEKSFKTDFKSAIQYLAYSPEQECCLAIAQDQKIAILDLTNEQELFSLNAPKQAEGLTVISPDGKTFASISAEAGIIIWTV